MPAFARRPNGSPTKTATFRIHPNVIARIEDFSRREALTMNLAVEKLLVAALRAEFPTDTPIVADV